MEETWINILFAGVAITLLAYLIILNKIKNNRRLKSIVKESRKIVYPEYIGTTIDPRQPHHNKKNANYHLTLSDGTSMVWAHEEMNAYDSLEMAFTYDDAHDIQQFSLTQQRELLDLARLHDLSGWLRWSSENKKQHKDLLHRSSCCLVPTESVDAGAHRCPKCNKFCTIKQ